MTGAFQILTNLKTMFIGEWRQGVRAPQKKSLQNMQGKKNLGIWNFREQIRGAQKKISAKKCRD